MNDMNFLNATTTSMYVSEFSGISNDTFENATNYDGSMFVDNNNYALFDKVSFHKKNLEKKDFYNHRFI